MNAALMGDDTGTAARILTAAEGLLTRRGYKGVTIAAVAETAHVAKATVYLYWHSKESLFLGLLVRNFLDALADLTTQIEARPELARPDHLCPQMVDAVLQRPLIRALQVGDGDLLGLLIDDPRTREIVRSQGAAALIRNLLPVWRRHGLARTDWPEDQQTYALQTVAAGYLDTTRREAMFGSPDSATRHDTIAAMVRAILDTPDTTADVAARDVITVLTESASALRAIMTD